MRLSQYQDRIIDDAITAAYSQYRDDTQKRDGFIAGVNACRGKDRDQLAELLVAANTAEDAGNRSKDGSVQARTFEIIGFRAGVEWVCDCMSAVYRSLKMDAIIEPSSQAYAKAANLLARNGVPVAVFKNEPAGTVQ